MSQNLQPGDLCVIINDSNSIKPECLKFVGRTVILLRIAEPPPHCWPLLPSMFPFWACGGLPGYIVSHANLRKIPPAPLVLSDEETRLEAVK